MQQLKWTLPVLAIACAASPARALPAFDDQTVECLMQMFTDSEKVRVRSAMGNYAIALSGDAALTLHWNNERVVIPAIAAAPGTQEAVDAITTASRPISGNAFEDFVKVRNEFQGGVRKGPASVEYYHSQESDYTGRQLSASWNRDIRGDQLNLSLGTSYGWDSIDPLADDDTGASSDHKTTVHLNAVATQIVGTGTQVRYGVEVNLVEGLQHNPYRNVYAGGTRVPERHPGRRQRRDAFVRVHQYLTNRASMKFNYRLYNDDWGIASHELGTKLSQTVSPAVFASWEYRYYTQSPAEFWRDQYASVDGIDGYRSGDYRMGPLSSHLFGVALDVRLETLAARHPTLSRFGLRCGYERYFNSNSYSANFVSGQVTCAF